MANPGEDDVFEDTEQTRHLVVIGKTGNGKSTLGNLILGSPHFKTGCSMTSTTVNVAVGEKCVQQLRIKVIDTPDIANLGLEGDEAQQEVHRWKALTSPDIHAILLAVRCDVRYTREEHEIYLQLKKLWGGNSLCRRLVVAFTFGDRQDADLSEDLKKVCPELKSVLREASMRYVLFNDRDTEEGKRTQVVTLLNLVQRLDAEVTQKEEERQLSGLQVCPQGPFTMFPCVQTSRSSSSGSRSSTRSRGSSSSDKEVIRLLLVGKTGTGKSSTGNTIIGTEVFPVNNGNNTPHASSRQETTIGSHVVQVVDTPGMQLKREGDTDLKKERKRALNLISPGPHALIFVVRYRGVDKDDVDYFKALQEQLGPSVNDHIILAIVGASEEEIVGESQMSPSGVSTLGEADGRQRSQASLMLALEDLGVGGGATEPSQAEHGQGSYFSELLREGSRLWSVNNKNANRSQVDALMVEVEDILNRTGGALCYGNQLSDKGQHGRARHSSGDKGRDHGRICWVL